MLSKPNVNELMKRVGNRYELALAISKRARDISRRRVRRGDTSIKDAVDIAASEIFEEKALVKKNGEYVLSKDSEEDMDKVISKTVDDILKDLAVKDDMNMIEPSKKSKKNKKDEIEEEEEKKVTDIVDEEKVKVSKKTKKSEKENE